MKHTKALKTKVFIFLTCLLVIMQEAFAGMTISGTRIIFPANQREYSVRTTNKGEIPLLAQVWIDDGSKSDDINKMKVPFAVTPPVFRIEPGKGQSVRLIYNGMQLPQDRESVFWFNLLEIPPVNEKDEDSDRIELAFRTRIKIFYRPAILKSNSIFEIERIKWQIIPPAKGIKVINPTPYYLSFDNAYIKSGGKNIPLVTDMVEPFGSKEMLIKAKSINPALIDNVTVRLINDYGSALEYKLVPLKGGNLLEIKKDN
ncbi:fimbrial biogenesis chaperone [Pantoea septica]|uniref:fimbrial biogenesis chaperone n=1 Tax=Pantoea septica TaxID=472695 RepID=UPI0035E3E748